MDSRLSEIERSIIFLGVSIRGEKNSIHLKKLFY